MLRTWARTLLGSAVLAILALCSTSITSRILGVEGRGLFALALVVITFASTLALLGLGKAYVFMARAGNWSHPLRSALLTSLTVCVAAIILAVPMSNTASSLGSVLAAWTVLAAASTACLGHLLSCTQIDPRLRTYNAIRVAAPALGLAIIAMLWALGRLSVTSTVASIAISGFLASLACVLAIARFKDRSDMTNRKPLSPGRFIALCFGYYGTTVLGLILVRADMIFLAVVNNLSQFGLYSAAYGLSRMIIYVQNAMGTTLFSRTAGTLLGTSHDADIGRESLRVFRLTLWPMLAQACCISFLSPWVVSVVLGWQFALSAVPFSILLFEGVIGAGSWLLAESFNAVGKSNTVLVRQLGSFVPLVALIWFIPPDSAAVWLATLLLLCALVRLVITLMLFRGVFTIPVSIWLSKSDVGIARVAIDRVWRPRTQSRPKNGG